MDYFHILNRGVEKRKIFQDQKDYIRFAFNLSDFNDKNCLDLSFYKRHQKQYFKEKSEKNNLVEVLCWCAMPNHFHIFEYEKRDKGTGLFSKKITSGYTQYFNLKNTRKGVLFQGRTKMIPISKDKHFLHLPYYILSNPIKLIQSDWKEAGIKNIDKTLKFLKEYKWSSLYEIINSPNLYPTITNTKHLFDTLNIKNKAEFIKNFEDWLSAMR